MRNITQAERVLIHLYSYRHLDESERHGVPFDITQDGVGESVGISRSHASLILGKMERNGLVSSRQASVDSAPVGTTLRKVYHLTRQGLDECESLMRSLGEPEGLDVEDIFPKNLNYCRSDAFDSLDRRDRDFLGCMMVLDGNVHVSQLPNGRNHPLLPIDARGFVAIREDVSERFLHRAGEDELRRWNSLAADWCADHGLPSRQRLRHLIMGGRIREAVRLAKDSAFELMDRPDAETTDALDRLDGDVGDGSISPMVTMCYIRLGLPKKARRALERMNGSDPCLRGALESEILLLEGKNTAALDTALECYRGDAPTAIALGKSMAANGRHSEAVVFLRRGRLSMRETGCLFRLDEALEWESESHMVLGNGDLAQGLMMAASCAAVDRTAVERLRTRAETMASQNRVAPERVDVRDVQVPDVLDAPLQHGEPLESEPPRQHRVLDPEGRDDLRPEYAGSAELHPLPVEEHLQLQRGLGVREVRGPDADLVEPHPGVELADDRDQHVEGGASGCSAMYLMLLTVL